MGHIGKDVTLDDPAFIHETALLYGKVYIGPGATVWPHVVMRSEMYEIRIGARTNIQDFTMVHVGGLTPTIIGEDCSITHHCTIHGCTIGDRTLIGINATVMDGAVIGANSIVAGHSIVGENKVFEDNAIIAGVPAKKIGERDSGQANLGNARFYELNGRNYGQGIERMSADDLKTLNLLPE